MLRRHAPDFDLKKLKHGIERAVMADLVVQLAATFKEDWFSDLDVWESLQMAAILLKMYQIHQRGKTATASAISRMGMPRTTVQRKLMALKKRGLIDQLGTKYVLSIEGMNAPHLIEGFAKRLIIVRSHLAQMLVALPTEQTRRVHALDTRAARPR